MRPIVITSDDDKLRSSTVGTQTLWQFNRISTSTSTSPLNRLIGNSPAWLKFIEDLETASRYDDISVLIIGERGNGKTESAEIVHELSPRKGKPFETVELAGIPRELLESTLFGHEKGAFTGAIKNKQGVFEIASEGTTFLDEFDELDILLQVKMLRILQKKKYRPVGATKDKITNTRIIAATNRNLDEAVRGGRLRADLRDRIGKFVITAPPLRARGKDLELLAEKFFCDWWHKCRIDQPVHVTKDAMNALYSYSWPGNVRQLDNVIMRAVCRAANGSIVTKTHIEESLHIEHSKSSDVDDVSSDKKEPEKELLIAAEKLIEDANGNITKAAERSGVGKRAFHRMLKHLREMVGSNSKEP